MRGESSISQKKKKKKLGYTALPKALDNPSGIRRRRRLPAQFALRAMRALIIIAL